MPNTFALQSVAVPLLWSEYFTTTPDQYVTVSSATLLDRIVGLGANDIRLVASYGQLASTTATTYNPLTPQSVASLKTFTDAAHAAGLSITWNPISNIDNVISGDPNQPSHLSPSDAALWFQNFRSVVLVNAQIAEDIGAARYQLLSDIEQPVFQEHPELADDMVALIAEVRTIFSGDITANIYTPDGLVDRYPRSILMAMDLIGLGLTPKLTTSNDATLEDLFAAWRNEANFGLDVIANLERLSAETGRPVWISDFVASSYDGSNTLSPNKFDSTATFVPDNAEQALYYEAALRAFMAYGSTWFQGISAQNISRIEDDNGLLPVYLQSDVGENFFGKPAGQILTQFFNGQFSPFALEAHGTDYGETITGGYGYNEIHAGRASQSLIGGTLADTFYSSMPGQTTGHTLTLQLSGNPANNTLPSFSLRVNGVDVPRDFSVSRPLDPATGQTITVTLLGSDPITSIELVTTNWYANGSDNRLMRVHGITLDGHDLAAMGIYHMSYGGTEPFTGDTNRGGYVSYAVSPLAAQLAASGTTVVLASNLSINGMDGVDTVVYAGNSSAFGISFDAFGQPTVKKPGTPSGQGTDSLVGIEILHFDDRNLWVSPIMDFSSDQMGRTVNLVAGAQSTADFGRGAVTVINAYDLGVVLAGSGSDTLVGNHFANTLFGHDGNDTLRGEGGDDGLYGDAGDDVIEGGEGNDAIDGGAGADILFGDTGDDTFTVDSQVDLVFEKAGEGTDSVIASGNFYLYANIENLVLAAGTGNVFGVGNDLANTITGNAGANLLLGGAGNDTMSGGAGSDVIYGEDGADTLNGGDDVDYLIGGLGNDVLNGGNSTDALYGEDGNDSLTGGTDFATDIIYGGNGDDVIYANSGLGDYDILNGAAGNDTYYVDTPNDIVYEGVGEGIDTVYASIQGAGYYLWYQIENCTLLGTTPFAAGNESNNVLTGSASANWLLGNGGNDVLNGKGGNDVLFGDLLGGPFGQDTFVFEANSGQDVIGDFHHGEDKIQLIGLYTDFATTMSHFRQIGGDCALDLLDGSIIVFQGLQYSTLTSSDFIFG